jgi:hypothetical protein
MKVYFKNEHMTVRTLSSRDELEKLIELENEVWPVDLACSRENFFKRFEAFPDGFLIALDSEGIVFGSFYGIFMNFRIGQGINWHRDSGEGTGSNHTPDGNSMFGISITSKESAPPGSMRGIVTAWKNFSQERGKKYIYGGSRISGFHQHTCGPRDYVDQVVQKKLFDPVLSKWLSCGMSAGELIENYFIDPESRNYGVEIYIDCTR